MASLKNRQYRAQCYRRARHLAESAVNETDIEDRPDLNTGNFGLAKHRQTEHPIE
jgi:hypothetical protein